MVVEDNRVNRQLLSALLKREGIDRVALAEDGEQALDQLAGFRPDLMLLDLMLPKLDGFEVCRRLRADPAFRDLPVLIQSTLNRAEDRARAFAAGATDYISKPINAVELIARVRVHLQNKLLLNSLKHYQRRTSAELALARRMQERLMPQDPAVETIGCRMGLVLESHFAPSSELGGDFWGLRVVDDRRLIVWIVDFSGHGVAAALHTFRLHTILRQMEYRGFEPARFLAEVNRRLCPLMPLGQFATMLVGLIDRDSDQFTYASAGSTAPMIWSDARATPSVGDSSGLPLGIVSDAVYQARGLPLPPGGRLFLYSDAAIETPVGDGVLEEEGLATLIRRLSEHDPSPPMMPRIVEALAALGPATDDLTTLLVTRTG